MEMRDVEMKRGTSWGLLASELQFGFEKLLNKYIIWA